MFRARGRRAGGRRFDPSKLISCRADWLQRLQWVKAGLFCVPCSLFLLARLLLFLARDTRRSMLDGHQRLYAEPV